MHRRVVITGMGAVTPIGNTVEEYWRGLLSGVSGVAPITLFDPSDYPTQIAAEVKGFDGHDYFDRKDLRMMARPTQFGVAAALMALEDADWRKKTRRRSAGGCQRHQQFSPRCSGGSCRCHNSARVSACYTNGSNAGVSALNSI